MPAKTKKITKAPSGTSFMYESKPANISTACPDPDCGGTLVMCEGGFPTCNEGSTFICTHCDWISPESFTHSPTKPTPHYVETSVVKKQAQKKQPRDKRDAFRAEARRRMARLVKAREAMPKDSSKLMQPARNKLHKLSFTHEMIPKEIS